MNFQLQQPSCEVLAQQLNSLPPRQLRLRALELLQQAPACERSLSQAYQSAADAWWTTAATLSSSERADDPFSSSSAPDSMLFRRQDAKDCEDFLPDIMTTTWVDINKSWDACCSLLPRQELKSTAQNTTLCPTKNLCCRLSRSSLSYLRLPALREPVLPELVLDMETDDNDDDYTNQSTKISIYLQQEGWLRPFDVAGVLWPSGYLLANCLAHPTDCHLLDEIEEAVHYQQQQDNKMLPIALELGCGVGAPSIALALRFAQKQEQQHPMVVATDALSQALDLTASNAFLNNIKIATSRMDFLNTTSMEELKARNSNGNGFALVYGSSLQQGLFQNTGAANDSALWVVLDILLDENNPHALGIFVHTREDPLEVPASDDAWFERVRTVSGDVFGMPTRWGGTSDFAIYVFRRRRRRRGPVDSEL